MINEVSTGCGGLRNTYVEMLREKYDVTVVTPNYYEQEMVINDQYILIPFFPKLKMHIYEAAGLCEDYLDKWSKITSSYLEKVVKKDDLIFATSGGELGCIKIAYYVQKHVGCKVIINLHDPVNYTHIGAIKVGGKLHVSRDNLVRKYMLNAEGIITWAHEYANTLKSMYPEIKMIKGIYRGYRKCKIWETHQIKKDFKIVYAGAMGRDQGVDKVIKTWGENKDIKIELIGNAGKKIKKLAEKYPNVTLLKQMPYEECMNYMKREADIGVVCIVAQEFGIATPSKLFDLINLELPILGIMPDGEGQNLINSGYGLAADYKEVEKNRNNLEMMKDTAYYNKITEYIKKKKPEWAMEKLFEEVYEFIDEVMGMTVHKASTIV